MKAYTHAVCALWSHLEASHGITALTSELDEIVRLSVAVDEARKAEEAMHAASEVILDNKKPNEKAQ